MRKAVETMQLGVTITDPDGHILYINPAEAIMHGYEVGELIGKNVRILAPQELWEPMTVDEIRQIVSFRRETVNRSKDGTIFPIQLTSDAVLNAEGNPIAIVTTSENITERKRAEDQLRRAHDELDRRVQERTLELTESIALLKEQINRRRHAEDALRNAKDMLEVRVEQRTRELAKINKALEIEANQRKQANEALERLVSGVAHEVRSPLFAISTSTQTLAKKLGNVHEYSQYIEMILSQVKRLSNLMMDLLEVGRPPQALLKTPQNIRDILVATKANVVAVAPHAEEMIVISEAADNQVVLGNREKLIQAFFNLVQNAVQHSPEKSMVNVTVDSDIENVKIGICDHGSGIPSQHLERV